jgi:hypothetical protein
MWHKIDEKGYRVCVYGRDFDDYIDSIFEAMKSAGYDLPRGFMCTVM